MGSTVVERYDRKAVNAAEYADFLQHLANSSAAATGCSGNGLQVATLAHNLVHQLLSSFAILAGADAQTAGTTTTEQLVHLVCNVDHATAARKARQEGGAAYMSRLLALLKGMQTDLRAALKSAMMSGTMDGLEYLLLDGLQHRTADTVMDSLVIVQDDLVLPEEKRSMLSLGWQNRLRGGRGLKVLVIMGTEQPAIGSESGHAKPSRPTQHVKTIFDQSHYVDLNLGVVDLLHGCDRYQLEQHLGAVSDYDIIHFLGEVHNGDLILGPSSPASRLQLEDFCAIILDGCGHLQCMLINHWGGAVDAGLQGLVEAGIKVITAYEAPISNTHAAIYCKAFYKAIAIDGCIEGAHNAAVTAYDAAAMVPTHRPPLPRMLSTGPPGCMPHQAIPTGGISSGEHDQTPAAGSSLRHAGGAGAAEGGSASTSSDHARRSGALETGLAAAIHSTAGTPEPDTPPEDLTRHRVSSSPDRCPDTLLQAQPGLCRIQAPGNKAVMRGMMVSASAMQTSALVAGVVMQPGFPHPPMTEAPNMKGVEASIIPQAQEAVQDTPSDVLVTSSQPLPHMYGKCNPVQQPMVQCSRAPSCQAAAAQVPLSTPQSMENAAPPMHALPACIQPRVSQQDVPPSSSAAELEGATASPLHGRPANASVAGSQPAAEVEAAVYPQLATPELLPSQPNVQVRPVVYRNNASELLTRTLPMYRQQQHLLFPGENHCPKNVLPLLQPPKGSESHGGPTLPPLAPLPNVPCCNASPALLATGNAVHAHSAVSFQLSGYSMPALRVASLLQQPAVVPQPYLIAQSTLPPHAHPVPTPAASTASVQHVLVQPLPPAAERATLASQAQSTTSHAQPASKAAPTCDDLQPPPQPTEFSQPVANGDAAGRGSPKSQAGISMSIGEVSNVQPQAHVGSAMQDDKPKSQLQSKSVPAASVSIAARLPTTAAQHDRPMSQALAISRASKQQLGSCAPAGVTPLPSSNAEPRASDQAAAASSVAPAVQPGPMLATAVFDKVTGYSCDVCGMKGMMAPEVFLSHLKGKRHQLLMAKQQKQVERQSMRARLPPPHTSLSAASKPAKCLAGHASTDASTPTEMEYQFVYNGKRKAVRPVVPAPKPSRARADPSGSGEGPVLMNAAVSASAHAESSGGEEELVPPLLPLRQQAANQGPLGNGPLVTITCYGCHICGAIGMMDESTYRAHLKGHRHSKNSAKVGELQTAVMLTGGTALGGTALPGLAAASRIYKAKAVVSYDCDICGNHNMTKGCWESHLAGKQHRRKAARYSKPLAVLEEEVQWL